MLTSAIVNVRVSWSVSMCHHPRQSFVLSLAKAYSQPDPDQITTDAVYGRAYPSNHLL